MPGWHEATEELREDGTIRMLGIVQEQHPDRARLFMQWKEMEWPILVDSYDLLEVGAVPITLAIDEAGIVRHVLRSAPRSEETLARFLAEPPARATPPEEEPTAPDLEEHRRRATRSRAAREWEAYANALAVWGGPDRLDDAIEAYEQATLRAPGDGMIHFRLGVALRMRYDLGDARPDDFQRAVEEWSTALDLDPNQYIWRRRIQQYGPRLEKPYPFYDWVPTAREEIAARGEPPSPLVVEPRGSEFASPQESFEAGAATEEPDPSGRVFRDEGEFIDAEVVTVPPAIEPGGVTRAHLVFRTIDETEAHWNNEAEPMVVWVDPPEGWSTDARSYTHPLPAEVVSREARSVEVEIRAPEDARPGSEVTIPGYALYYVCEDVNGICMYRRQDVEIAVRVR